jgi:Xaa-Pro aminopeptidase
MTLAHAPASGREIFEKARKDRRDLFPKERFGASLSEAKLDGVVASSQANVTYTGGVWTPDPLLWTFVVTTASGRQSVITNEADAFVYRNYSWITDIREFRFGPESSQRAVQLLVDTLDDLGLSNAAVGTESGTLAPWISAHLSRALPEVSWRDAAALFERCRQIKTPAEQNILRLATYMTSKAIETAFALSRAGEFEKQLANRMQSHVLALGADALGHLHVASGLHSTIVHCMPLESPMEPGEVVHVDFGAAFAGYRTDISRNAVIGRPTSRQAEIYRLLREIEELLFEKLRPGVKASEIYDFAQRQHESRSLVYPWGTQGHSTGLGVHEGFEFAKAEETLLEEGMVVNVEPTHIEPGDARYHIEDSVLITRDGCEVLSRFSVVEELFVIQ